MRRAAFLVISLVVALFPLEQAQAESIRLGDFFVEGELLVQMEPGAKAAVAQKAHERLGATVVKTIKGSGGIQLVKLPPGMSVREAIAAYRKLDGVMNVGPNHIRTATGVVPNDFFFFNLWGLHNSGQTGGTRDADIDGAADDLLGEPVGAWDLATGDPNVVIAVVDTGIQPAHPDLAPNMWVNFGELELDVLDRITNMYDDDSDGVIDDFDGTPPGSGPWSLVPGERLPIIDFNGIDDDGDGIVDDFDGAQLNGIDDDGNGYVDDIFGVNTLSSSHPIDDNGHGTHVSGTIGAKGDNSIGVVGVSWDARIMACKFLDSSGSGTLADELEALYYIIDMADMGENIVAVNASYGGIFPDNFESAAIQALGDRGILFIAAAGNDALDNDALFSYPASYDLPNVISVAATDHNDILANFSNFGRRTVDVGAPGVAIWSTLADGGYGPTGGMSGTSMATPHVAGLAGLLYSDPANPRTRETDWTSVRNLILSGGNVDTFLAGKTVTGRRVNARHSLECSDSAFLARIRPVTSPWKAWMVESGEFVVIWLKETGKNEMTAIVGTDEFGARFGNRIGAKALHLNCGSPNGEVPIRVRLSFFNKRTLWLQDDGGSVYDVVPNDGIYAMDVIPPLVERSYEISFPNYGAGTTAGRFVDTFTVYVRQSSNPFVVADAGADTTVKVSQENVTLDGSISSGPDSIFAPLFYTWQQVGGLSVSLKDIPETPYDDRTSPWPVFDAPAEATTLVFQLTVEDLEGNQDTDSVTVRVNP